jgi:hypothetical protein
MNNRLIVEGRFLVNMAGAFIRQDDQRPIRGQLDWERIYRVADYHKITNLVYLAMLGNGKKIPQKWQDAFAERYWQGLQYGDVCKEAEQEILALLDMRNISCAILESCDFRNLYQIPESASNIPLRLLMDEESYTLAKGYLIDLGYETDRFYTGFGERMKRVSGIRVEIYRKPPFQTHAYEKQMQFLMRRVFVKEPYHTVRTLSLEDRFIYFMAKSAYRYAQDELVIRELMDLYLYHRTWQEQISQDHVRKVLSDFHVEQLAEKLLHLAYMWFGSMEELKLEEGQRYEPEEYDVLEGRILSRGILNHEVYELDQQAVMLREMIEKSENKERRQERFERWKQKNAERRQEFGRKLRWIFPEYRYMCTIYPILEKLPPLLPICWLLRLIRFLFIKR